MNRGEGWVKLGEFFWEVPGDQGMGVVGMGVVQRVVGMEVVQGVVQMFQGVVQGCQGVVQGVTGWTNFRLRKQTFV